MIFLVRRMPSLAALHQPLRCCFRGETKRTGDVMPARLRRSLPPPTLLPPPLLRLRVRLQ